MSAEFGYNHVLYDDSSTYENMKMDKNSLLKKNDF